MVKGANIRSSGRRFVADVTNIPSLQSDEKKEVSRAGRLRKWGGLRNEDKASSRRLKKMCERVSLSGPGLWLGLLSVQS